MTALKKRQRVEDTESKAWPCMFKKKKSARFTQAFRNYPETCADRADFFTLWEITLIKEDEIRVSGFS